jgi:hypothetical protein
MTSQDGVTTPEGTMVLYHPLVLTFLVFFSLPWWARALFVVIVLAIAVGIILAIRLIHRWIRGWARSLR